MGTIALRLKPGAKHERISRLESGEIVIGVTSPPVEGKANNHLIKFLAKTLGIPKSSCRIIKGHTARNKVVEIDGMASGEIQEKLRVKSEV